MAARASVHVCSACGHETARWAGRCPGCGEWNTLVEEARPRPSARPTPGGRTAVAARPVALADVAAPEQERLRTGIGELDDVLGGGIVPGSLILIGGAPG